MPNRVITEDFVDSYLKGAISAPLPYVHPDEYLKLMQDDCGSVELLPRLSEYITSLLISDLDYRANKDGSQALSFQETAVYLIRSLMEICKSKGVTSFTLAQKPLENRHLLMVRVIALVYSIILEELQGITTTVKIRSSVGTIVQLLTHLWERFYRSKGDPTTLWTAYVLLVRGEANSEIPSVHEVQGVEA